MAEKKSSGSLLVSGLSLSFLTLCSRVLGLVREMTKAHFLGNSKYADAFGIAFMIPNLLRRLFAENAVSVAFIPTFRNYLSDSKDAEGKNETKEFLNATLTLLTFLVTCVVVAGIVLTPLIVRIFDKDAADIAETSLITRIMFPYLLVISIAAFFQGILNGVKIFSVSGFTPVLFNSIVIAMTYILTPFLTGGADDEELRQKMAARAMSIGVITGGLVQALFQLPFVIKTGWSCHFTTLKKAFTNPGTRRVMVLIVPTIIGMAAYQLNDVVSTALAKRFAEEGAVASLQYSLRLQELILGVFAVSIGTIILPDLTGLAKEEKWQEFNLLLIKAIKVITLIAVPVTFYSLITGKEIISLVYKSGRFDDKSVLEVLEVFKWHIAGLLFIAANRIISPAFYAQGNTKLPTLAGIIGFVFNIALAAVSIFAFNMGRGGIALALSVASFINTVFLFIFLRKTHITDVGKLIFRTFLYALKITVFSAAAGVPAFFVHAHFVRLFAGYGRFLGNGIPLAVSGICFFACGIILLTVTRDEIMKIIIRKLLRRR